MPKNCDPYLDAGVKGWIWNQARANFWKMSGWYEFDDLVQDGYLCYAKCRNNFKYAMEEPTEENRKEFMGYFQMAFRNHIIDLANSRTDTPEAALATLPEGQADAVESWAESAADLGDASLAAMLAKAPAEILEILKQLLVDGVADGPYLKTRLREKLVEGALPRITVGRRKIRETTEQFYDRCLGQPGVVAKLRNYFLSNGEMTEAKS